VSDDATVKLVISDVDGTLVDAKKQVTPGVQAAVARLREAGVGFTIISARPRSGMMPIAELLQIDAPMGAFNGGTVFTRDGTVTAQHRVERAVVEGVFAVVADAAVDTWVFADDTWYASTDQGAHVHSERLASNQAPIVTQDFTALFDRVDKLTFVSDDAALLAGLADRASAYGDRATIAQSQVYYLDVTALVANKGDGVVGLSDTLGVPLTHTAVLGDQANDLPMFARAAVSYAMGQGPEAVRAKATHVVAGNDHDGVAEAIDAILAGRWTAHPPLCADTGQ
jgi:Cof subfamily protein (haloacid dehalogenase superfamily)